MTNVANKSWTYSYALKQDFSSANLINTAYEQKKPVAELKQTILNVCSGCANTQAFRTFKYKLDNMTSAENIIFFVYDAWLKGSGCGVIKN